MILISMENGTWVIVESVLDQIIVDLIRLRANFAYLMHASNAKDRIQFNRNVGGKSFFMLVAKFFPLKIFIVLFSGRTFGMSHFIMRSFEASFKVFGPKIYRVFLGTNFERSQIKRPIFC